MSTKVIEKTKNFHNKFLFKPSPLETCSICRQNMAEVVIKSLDLRLLPDVWLTSVLGALYY